MAHQTTDPGGHEVAHQDHRRVCCLSRISFAADEHLRGDALLPSVDVAGVDTESPFPGLQVSAPTASARGYAGLVEPAACRWHGAYSLPSSPPLTQCGGTTKHFVFERLPNQPRPFATRTARRISESSGGRLPITATRAAISSAFRNGAWPFLLCVPIARKATRCQRSTCGLRACSSQDACWCFAQP